MSDLDHLSKQVDHIRAVPTEKDNNQGSRIGEERRGDSLVGCDIGKGKVGEGKTCREGFAGSQSHGEEFSVSIRRIATLASQS